MNKTVLIIAIVIAAIFGGGFLLINSNPALKAQAEKIGIIDKPAPPEVAPSSNAVFIIFDPSGSGTSSYSVPKISTEYITKLIDCIAELGNGDLWLTYVDKDSKNNKVLHFDVAKTPSTMQRPNRQSGERKGEYDRRVAKFESDSVKEAKEIAAYTQVYEERQMQFLSECQGMIDAGYAPKKSGEDFSDCIGSLNTALRSLATVQHDSINFRSILFISDGVQDLKAGAAKQKLKTIPEDIKVVTISHSGSKNNVVAGRSIEVENLDRGLEKAVQFYSPLKK